MALDSIKDSVQEVAEAISAVLHVDVTIIDNSFKRIAATGDYKKLIGSKIPSKCLFEYILKEKKPLYIKRNPTREDEYLPDLVCNTCEAKDTCTEFATVGYPIMKNEDVVGIIGINVFDEKQCDIISKDFNSMIVFLNKLSTLLVGNIIYKDTIKNLEIQKEETNHIIDSLNDGILCIDNNGFVKYLNRKGEKLLDVSEASIKNNHVNTVLPDLNVGLLGREFQGKAFNFHSKKQSFLVKSSPIIWSGERVSNIVQFNKKSDEVRAAYKLLGGSNIVRFEDIIGESNSIKNVKVMAKSIAKTDSTVILRGESGTGKELFARSIHYESHREEAPFIAVNCASIPDNLLESEFFGYEGGAFSGARREGQIGKFELASGGTIFLDEIGDLPLHLQPKILRVLQEHSFRKIGGKEEIYVDVRVIAATNKNLEAMVKNGEFREDLYYRLNVIPIYLPSLKERGEDIFLLSKYLLSKFCCRFNMKAKQISQEVKEIFNTYSWPGNIRELENVIEYAVNIAKEEVIGIKSLPVNFINKKRYLLEEINSDSTNISGSMKNIQNEESNLSLERVIESNINVVGNNIGLEAIKSKGLKSTVEEFEKSILLEMINTYGNHGEGKNKIIEALDIDLSTLYRKLKKYNLQ